MQAATGLTVRQFKSVQEAQQHRSGGWLFVPASNRDGCVTWFDPHFWSPASIQAQARGAGIVVYNKGVTV